MSGGSSWRSPSTADQYQHHDYADFAQEYLQRNADYRRDHADTAARIAKEPALESKEQEGLAGRWGLSFPHCAWHRSANGTSFMVARDRTRCRHAGDCQYRDRCPAAARL